MEFGKEDRLLWAQNSADMMAATTRLLGDMYKRTGLLPVQWMLQHKHQPLQDCQTCLLQSHQHRSHTQVELRTDLKATC